MYSWRYTVIEEILEGEKNVKSVSFISEICFMVGYAQYVQCFA